MVAGLDPFTFRQVTKYPFTFKYVIYKKKIIIKIRLHSDVFKKDPFTFRCIKKDPFTFRCVKKKIRLHSDALKKKSLYVQIFEKKTHVYVQSTFRYGVKKRKKKRPLYVQMC